MTRPLGTLRELVRAAGGELLGPDLTIARVATLALAGPADLAPFTHPRYRDALAQTMACAILTSPRLVGDAVARGLSVWVHPDPAVALANLLGRLEPAHRPGVHPRATVDESARVDPSAQIGAGAVVCAEAVVGHTCTVGPNAVIGARTVLGARVRVGAGAVVGSDGFGFARTAAGLVRVPHQGIVVVEEDVEIGANSTIARATLGETRIRHGTKIDNLVHIGHNVELGPHAALAAQVGIAGSTSVGAGVQIGGQAGIADHVNIAEGARLAAKSGVIGDVPAGATFAGYPAVERHRWLREQATLARLARRRPTRAKGED